MPLTDDTDQPAPTEIIPARPGRTLLVGCGKVGSSLGERLVAAGEEVVALRRTTAGLPASFAALSVDLREPVRQELPQVDTMLITLTPGMSSVGDHPNAYLVALRNLAAALSVVPPRVVFVSSTRVFEGRTGHQTLTEDDAPAPVTPRGRTLWEGELLAMDLFDAHIVRPAGIYGPGREMMIRKVVERTPVQYTRRTNRIHEVDLVRALEKVLMLDHPPRLVHAVDQKPASLGEVVTFIAEQLGMQPPPALPTEPATGTVLGGGLLLNLLETLSYPTFEAGYEHILAHRTR
ncbi:sugar nucleotide-binding protein [Corynebacterium sp. A21]|uniref:sugar nucleotide-binding protein n=1 Tax=Corynebacterium sp. A21 TaxID=3457318 RepID=UPI003FCEEE66